MKSDNPIHIKKQPLSDKELAAKYDTGGKVNFDRGLKKMFKAPSPTAAAKAKK